MGTKRATVRVLRHDDVVAALDMAACIDAVEAAFTAYAAGRAELPTVIQLDVPEHGGEIHVKAGHLHDEAFYAVKIVSGFPENPELGLPAADGMVLAFDARTGAPAAVLLDRGHITDVRTGAAGGVAARHLAPANPGAVAMIGSGVQARMQLDALSRVRSFDEVRIWGRDAARAARAASDVRALASLPGGCAVRTAASVEHAVRDAGVVVTATASRVPLLRAAWLAPGVHVTALGSDQPDKQELDPDVLARADLVVADSVPQCLAIGELHHAAEAGAIDPATVVELGAVTGGSVKGRADDGQLTVCDLTGVGVQDVAAAVLVLRNAGDTGSTLEA
ncbi:MAG TPA: ornithine cyclodeaminase family protein [Actinomycetota bacterium]|nr:ornithine cyclodeaminase family protein [Actinomycetota bacterium]